MYIAQTCVPTDVSVACVIVKALTVTAKHYKLCWSLSFPIVKARFQARKKTLFRGSQIFKGLCGD